MTEEQIGPEKRAAEKQSISDYMFICPQCGKEIQPSSICEDCFPNGSNLTSTTEQESDSEFYKIEPNMLEIQSNQILEKEVKNTENDSEMDQFTWQDFLLFLKVLSSFYKKYTKKIWLLSSIIIFAIATYTGYQYFSPKGKLILFVEKKDLVFSFTKKPLEKHILEKNWNTDLRSNSSIYNYYSTVRASQDEKYIFYREQSVTNDSVLGDELSTYYRFDVENNKKIKMDDQVRISFTGGSTNISPNGSKAIYTKGTDSKLVYWNNGKKKVIDDMVSFYLVNKQATHVFYGKQGNNYDNQGEIYEWSAESGKKTVAEKVALQGLQMDQNGEITIYFKKEKSIYCKKGNKDTKLISANATNILSCCGEKVYYTVSTTLPFTYRDFVNDTLVEPDKEIVEPTSSTDNGEKYFQKSQRDQIRQSFDNQITTIVSDLYYFDGKESTLLNKNIGVSGFYQVSKNPLMIYRKIDENMLQQSKVAKFKQQKIDIGTVYDISQLDAHISQLLNRDSKLILAQGIKKGLIEQNNGTQFMVSPNGKWIGFIDDSSQAIQDPFSSYSSSSSYYAVTGKLKKFKIDDLTEFKPTVVDEGVNTNFFFKGNDLFYTKGTFEGYQSVDLYTSGKKLLENIDEGSNASFDMYRYYGQTITKTTDENTFYGLDDGYRNLYKVNGNSKRKLAKNVEMYVPLKDKSILYIKDYKIPKGYGKLIVDDGKNKPVLISTQASMIFQNNDFLMYY